jgi:hypothetical protein
MHDPNANAKCNAKAKTNAEVESEESRNQLNEKLEKQRHKTKNKLVLKGKHQDSYVPLSSLNPEFVAGARRRGESNKLDTERAVSSGFF